MSNTVLTTAMIVPNTQDLMHDVTMSQDVMARQAESSMTLAETPYTVSARPTLAARPAMHEQASLRQAGQKTTDTSNDAGSAKHVCSMAST